MPISYAMWAFLWDFSITITTRIQFYRPKMLENTLNIASVPKEVKISFVTVFFIAPFLAVYIAIFFGETAVFNTCVDCLYTPRRFFPFIPFPPDVTAPKNMVLVSSFSSISSPSIN